MKARIHLAAPLIALSFAAAGAAFAQSGDQLGKVEFPNSCSPAVQEKLLRGIKMLHSFYYSATQKAFEDVDAALAAGELVCIFPEGTLTRDGQIAPFKTGLERILAKRPVPVVPLALKGMWLSMWSRRDTRLGRLRLPRRLFASVEVEAGMPIPGDQASAASLESKVRAMRGDRA